MTIHTYIYILHTTYMLGAQHLFVRGLCDKRKKSHDRSKLLKNVSWKGQNEATVQAVYLLDIYRRGGKQAAEVKVSRKVGRLGCYFVESLRRSQRIERKCVCVCVFIELRITAQSGPVILVILCHSH